MFLAEGPKIVAELLMADHVEIQQVYAVRSWLDLHPGGLAGTEVIEVSGEELTRISQLVTPNQVLALVKKIKPAPVDIRDTVTLALDGIRDPGNLGTIIRIADWFGIDRLICSEDCADLYNPKVVQATMGSIARVNLLYTRLPEWLSSQSALRIYATVLEGQDVKTVGKLREGIVVIGNESGGISDEVLKRVNVKITVPRKGAAESLNAAVATGIVLSHLV